MRVIDTGSAADVASFTLIGVADTFRVNANNTTTDLVEITAQSDLYGVQFTWDLTKATFEGEGARNAAQQKTTDVNAIAAADHVYAIRGEQSQDASGVLYNYLVVTVGTDDGAITTDVRIRMDQLATPGAFGMIDTAWKNLVSLGAS